MSLLVVFGTNRFKLKKNNTYQQQFDYIYFYFEYRILFITKFKLASLSEYLQLHTFSSPWLDYNLLT